MSGQHVLAIDQGTTSSRAMIFDEHGQSVANAQQEFRQIYPQDGWVEHDPEDIWQSVLSVCRQALRQALESGIEVAGSGSPTNVRPPWYGTARLASRSATLLSGRIAARRGSARSSKRPATKNGSPHQPDYSLTPTFPQPSWPGFLIMLPGYGSGRNEANWRLARLTPFCSGG